MRKRYYEWLELSHHQSTEREALDLQNQIAALLEERYGYDITDRFLTADDADSANPSGTLMPTQEYAGRIVRLRGIIARIRSGKIKRKVDASP
jgi:hypothetical protein